MLVVIVILGIAGAMVIPSMGTTGVLRVQGAVRTIIADITFMQSDAVAFQEKRAMVFDVTNSSYRIVAVPGDSIDATTNTLYKSDGPNQEYIVELKPDDKGPFGDSRITDVDFEGGGTTLIFDALGGPVTSATGDTPSSGGYIEVKGAGQIFLIEVEGFTGRVTVQRVSP
jgi:type II secretory pathway pseudopilin PulG